MHDGIDYKHHSSLSYIGTVWLDTGQVFEFYKFLNYFPESKLLIVRTDNEEFEAYYLNNSIFFGHTKYSFYDKLLEAGVVTPTYDRDYNAVKFEFSEEYKQSRLY